jgi:phenylpropionate dioxygenase-like ring-hydroxylating dioxygenase large terminal subunit
VRLHIDYGDDGALVLMFFHQPVDRENTTLYCLALAENIADGRMQPEEHIAFQAEVAREDRELLEQIRVKAVPLDPGVETHTRADKITVELRRLLNEADALTNMP